MMHGPPCGAADTTTARELPGTRRIMRVLRAGREVVRGESKKPLLVTSTGDLDEAARAIATMAGPYRVPHLLKRVDQLVRKAAEPTAAVG